MKDKLRELLGELMSACEMIGYATSGNERANHRATRDKAKAELLAALAAQGQGEAVAPFIIGNAYRTKAGELVRFVSIHNEGTSYETMADESGVHRYTRRDFGRVTGTAHDYSDPGNTPPLYTTAPPASPAGVPDATEVHADLPPGYRMATRDGDYWPLFGDSYCTGHAFPTRELAALEAWKQAHEKLNGSMASIRRFAAAPSATPEGGEVEL